MAQSNVVTVAATPTLLNALPDSSRGCSSIVLAVPTGTTLYLGGPAVTTANGLPVVGGGAPVTIDLDNNETLYGVVATGTASVPCLQLAI